MKYYTNYGLAILGLVQHHQVNALEFNEKVDDALPLDTVLKPDPALRQLLLDIDRENVKLWLLTNAYVTHGKRVVKLLGVDDLFEGITFCDYGVKDVSQFIAKPARAMYERAMKEAGASETTACYFVDDSYINAKGAQEFGWSTVHLVEPGEKVPEQQASKYVARDLEELRAIFPELFKTHLERT
jgi:pyrimidine and pyridine-specific 5'-nucleotidase